MGLQQLGLATGVGGRVGWVTWERLGYYAHSFLWALQVSIAWCQARGVKPAVQLLHPHRELLAALFWAQASKVQRVCWLTMHSATCALAGVVRRSGIVSVLRVCYRGRSASLCAGYPP